MIFFQVTGASPANYKNKNKDLLSFFSPHLAVAIAKGVREKESASDAGAKGSGGSVREARIV